MGRPKATLPLGEKTFLQTVVDLLREGGCDEVWVVVPQDDELIQAAAQSRARLLLNPDPGDGPITSLRLAIRALPAEVQGIVYLPVDHPLVSPSTVHEIVTTARATTPSLVIPMLGEDRGHPSYLGRSLFEELLDPALQGGARIVVHRHLAEAVLLPVSDAGVRADVDTPEAYSAALLRAQDKAEEMEGRP